MRVGGVEDLCMEEMFFGVTIRGAFTAMGISLSLDTTNYTRFRVFQCGRMCCHLGDRAVVHNRGHSVDQRIGFRFLSAADDDKRRYT